MGFSVQLLTERGETLEVVDDPRTLLYELMPNDENSHVLQYLDPYGYTILNNLQAPRFLLEWEEVEARASTPEEKALTTAIRRLSRRCAEGHQQYLKFVGD